MITAFDCVCGNKDASKAKFYDGALGYEAIICKVCGTTYDFDNEGKPRTNPPDEWSRNFVGLKSLKVKKTKEEVVLAITAKQDAKIAKIKKALNGKDITCAKEI
jgi:transcription elongation factor Elf1